MTDLRLDVMFSDGTQDFILLRSKHDWLTNNDNNAKFWKNIVSELKYQMHIVGGLNTDNVNWNDYDGEDDSRYTPLKPDAVPAPGETFNLDAFRPYVNRRDVHSLETLARKSGRIIALTLRPNIKMGIRDGWVTRFQINRAQPTYDQASVIEIHSLTQIESTMDLSWVFREVAANGHRFVIESDSIYLNVDPRQVALLLEFNTDLRTNNETMLYMNYT